MNRRPVIGFRTDASREIGTGHLMRCLTLADALRAGGADCRFLIRPTPLTDSLRAAGHGVELLPNEFGGEAADADACLARLPELVDWLVVDHYGLSADWERRLRPRARRIAAIDDLADRPHDADLLLDQNEVADREQRYQGLLPAGCRSLLGSRYALLRPEFTGIARRPRDGRLQRVLVNFGGSDPGNATGLALAALAALPEPLTVDVVIGQLHPAIAAITELCQQQPSWTLHLQTRRMAELMAAADFCLGASGSTAWERCAMGLPSLLLTVADNQHPLAAAIARRGAAIWPGDAADVSATQLAGLIQALRACPDWLRAMSDAAAALCDGRGTARVAAALLAEGLALRPATPADEALTLNWRNHPSVRRHSGDGAEIDANQHRGWLTRVLADADRQLLIAELAGEPLAVLRFDGLAGGEPEISIYLDPQRLGLGWGSEVLRAATGWLKAQHPARAIRARIHPDNRGSQRAFHEAGYQPQTQWWTLCL